MKNLVNQLRSGMRQAISVMALVVLYLPSWGQAAEPTAMEQKFGVSDSTILFLLIGFAVMFTILIITVNDSIKNLAKSHDLWKGKNFDKIPLILLAVTFASPLSALAGPYAEVETSAFILDETTFWILVLADLFLFGIALYYIMMLRKLTRAIRGEAATEPAFAESGPTVFTKFMKVLTDAVPIEKETDVLTDHDYDGIQELDNNLPPWWKWMFYISIGWGLVYLVYYHVLQMGPLQDEEYAIAMETAEAEVQAYLESKALNVDENSVEFLADQSRLDQGAGIYKKNCVQCHGQLGEGGVGPNLTDQYWIHGGGIKDLFKTIKYGVPTKGMIPWQDQLSPIQIQNVATYIYTMRGTNPPNGKEPQGEIWVDATETEQAPAAADSTATPATEPAPETDQSLTGSVSQVTE